MKRAKISDMPMPQVIHETWDVQKLMQEVAKLKGQMAMMTSYVQALADKHNGFIDNTAAALAIRKQRIETTEAHLQQHETLVSELREKMNGSETWANTCNQRLQQLENNVV